MEVEFYTEGFKHFQETIDKMVKGLHPDKVEPHLKWGAQIIAKEIRANAPERTGKLRGAVRTKKLKRMGGPAPYIAAIDRKKAPHAHMVSLGTGLRRVDPPRLVNLGGRMVRINNTGRMPRNPYFYNSVREKQGAVLNGLEQRIAKMLTEAMK